MANTRVLSYFLLFIFAALTAFITYGVVRDETALLVSCYAGLVGLYGFVFLKEKEITFWLIGSFVVRFSLLVALPNLSDDFYRFIWDGRLWAAGQHPFAALPADFLSQNISGLDLSLFEKLNSKTHFTVYPPVAQFIFWMSVKISPHSITGSVIVMRMLVLFAEAGSVVLILKLLEHFQLPRKNVLLYALNPLIILEFTGNLHFEVFAIFFLLLSVWWLGSKKIVISAVAFAFAIGVKLVPLIFLPLMIGVLGFRKALIFYAVVGLSSLILFITMLDQQVLAAFSDSLGLYFQNFEFNASVYYLVREYGFWKLRYNIIYDVGWKLAAIAGTLILAYASLQVMRHEGRTFDSMPAGFIFTLFIYLIFATTVHPWYITPLIAFSMFTRFRFGVVWSGMIFLTYCGYSMTGFSEKLWLTVIEYIVVCGYLGYELMLKKEKESQEERRRYVTQ